MTGTFSRLDNIERRLDRIEEEINFETHKDSLFPELTKEYEDSLIVGDKKDSEKPQLIEYNIVVSKDSSEHKTLQILLGQNLENIKEDYIIIKKDLFEKQIEKLEKRIEELEREPPNYHKKTTPPEPFITQPYPWSPTTNPSYPIITCVSSSSSPTDCSYYLNKTGQGTLTDSGDTIAILKDDGEIVKVGLPKREKVLEVTSTDIEETDKGLVFHVSESQTFGWIDPENKIDVYSLDSKGKLRTLQEMRERYKEAVKRKP